MAANGKLTLDDINAMNKAALKKALIEHVEQVDHTDASVMTVLLEMRKEITELRAQVTQMQSKIDSMAKQESPIPSQTFAKVLRSTVESTIEDAETKKDLILSKVQEGNDQQFLGDLCTKMEFTPKPVNPMRIGRKTEQRTRLLKVSFPSDFDARKFKSRFEQMKHEKKDIPDIRVRSSKTKEERENFSKNSKITHELNKEAKDAGGDYSFSLRENGSIWKFVKGEDGRWKRDKEWSHQGNGA